MNFVRFNDPSAPSLNRLAREINGEAEIAKIPPCLLAAIVNRETGGRNVLQDGMSPGPGCGVGLCQITAGVDWKDSHPRFAGYDLLNESDNLYVAAAYFLAPLIASASRIQRDNPQGFERSCRGQVIYAAAAGYNGGFGMVLDAVAGGYDCDAHTTNGYAADVFSHYLAFCEKSKP